MKERNKMSSIKNIIIISSIISNKMEAIRIPGNLSKSGSSGSGNPCLWLYASRYPKFPSCLAFNDEMQIFELTSRRGHVATWSHRDVLMSLTSAWLTRRRDVGTSRRDSEFLACSSLFQNCFQKLFFSLY